MLLQKEILGDYTLSLDMLNDTHWLLHLRFAKASKRFYQPVCRGCVLGPCSGLSTGCLPSRHLPRR